MEGLLSTGPTPSSFLASTHTEASLQGWPNNEPGPTPAATPRPIPHRESLILVFISGGNDRDVCSVIRASLQPCWPAARPGTSRWTVFLGEGRLGPRVQAASLVSLVAGPGRSGWSIISTGQLGLLSDNGSTAMAAPQAPWLCWVSHRWNPLPQQAGYAGEVSSSGAVQ